MSLDPTQFEVRRKVEIALCEILGEMLPDVAFYPAQGGTAADDAGMPKAPFCAIQIRSAQKMISYLPVWAMEGVAVYITKIELTSVNDHSQVIRAIDEAIRSIAAVTNPTTQIAISGVDVSSSEDFTDSERKAHGDVIRFTAGISEG